MAGKKVCGLQLAPVDTVAGETMKVEIDVDGVLLAEIEGTVDLGKRLIVNVRPVGRLAPNPVGKRQARKVETPLLHHGEIRLFEGWLGVVTRPPLPLNIEAAIARDVLRESNRQVSRNARLRPEEA